MSSTADREIVISRVVDAPRELAWLAMTEPAHLVQWWGPTGFTTTMGQMDVRPGGVWTMTMHGPDGTDYPNYSVFQEVVYPERIVFACGAEPDKPELFISTWTFEAVGEATRVTIRMVFPSAETRDAVVRDYGAIEGAEQTLGRLAVHLPEMGVAARSVVIERVVDAAPAVVFGCWRDAARLARWWAPHGFTNPVCEADVRAGGAWRIVMRAPDGTEYPCGGVYLAVVPGERLLFTNIATNAAGEAVHWLTLRRLIWRGWRLGGGRVWSGWMWRWGGLSHSSIDGLAGG